MPKVFQIYVGSRFMHAASITHRPIDDIKGKLRNYPVSELQRPNKFGPGSLYTGFVGNYKVIWDQLEGTGGCLTIIGRHRRGVEEIALEMLGRFALEEVEIPGYNPREPKNSSRR